MAQYCMHCMQPVGEQEESCPFCGERLHCEVPEHCLRPGTVLNHRYYVGKTLGQGGFGITYIGRDINLDMRVAIKEFYPTGYVNRNNATTMLVRENTESVRNRFFDQGRERFLREARALAKFSGEIGIVNVRDFFEKNNTAYIVMEYLEGRTLKEYLAEQGTIAPGKALELLMPVLQSLAKIHKQGIIHRDISPDNIMLVGDQVKLLDFGAAREVGGDKSMSIMLKQGYAPEEQYRSRGKQGPWTDVYAICAVIYKCITGITPDEALDRMAEDEIKLPSRLGIDISSAFEKALMKGLAVFQKDRYQSIDELLSGFQGIDKTAAEDGATVYMASGQTQDPRSEDAGEEAAVYALPEVVEEEDTEGKATVYAASESEEAEERATVYVAPETDDAEDGATVYVAPESEEAEETATVYVASETNDAEDSATVYVAPETDDAEEGATVHAAPEEQKAGAARAGEKTEGTASEPAKNIGADRRKTAVKGSSENPPKQKEEEKEVAVEGFSEKSREKKEKEKTGSSGKSVSGQATGETEKKKKGSRKVLLLAAVPVLIVAAVLLIFTFRKLGESPYKIGSGATIRNETINSDMLKKISADSEITRVTFYSCKISDDMIEKISEMKYITDITFDDCTGFTTLSPLAEMENLETLTVDGSDEGGSKLDGAVMFPVEFSGVDDLSLNYWTFTTGTEFLRNFPNLVYLTMQEDDGIVNLSALADMSDLYSVVLNGSDLSGASFGLSGYGSLSRIEVKNCNLTSISWAKYLTEPRTLLISDNQISSLEPLEGWTELTTLEVNNNQLTSLDGLEGHENLATLRAEGNQIEDITALADCTGLTTLELGDNRITSIKTLANCTGLTTLVLDGNQLFFLDGCEKMLYLKYLSAANNNILDIEGLTNATQLETVCLGGNSISDITVLGKSGDKLKTVLLDDNQITDISALAGSGNLYLLSIDNNQITNLDALADSAELYYLSACGNQITDISGLSGCTDLYYIDLGENAITDISPFTATTASSRILLLQNNQISDISGLAVSCSYKELSLYNNSIEDYSALASLSGQALCVNWETVDNYSQIAESSFLNYEIYLVDVPIDSQANIANLHAELMGSSPTFLTTGEAATMMEEWRAETREKW